MIYKKAVFGAVWSKKKKPTHQPSPENIV